MNAELAFIGGSGFYNPDLLENPTTVAVKTPFGPPSGDIVLGQISGKNCAFLARHGAGHRFSPSRINYRANVYALKTLRRRKCCRNFSSWQPQRGDRTSRNRNSRPNF